MSDFLTYLSALYAHWMAFLSAFPFLIDRLITWFWPRARKWLDNFPHRRKLFLGIMIAGVFYAGFLVWEDKYIAEQSLADTRVKMNISNVAFDPNGPTELYVEFVLSNPGPPTIVDDWLLTVRREGKILWDKHPPRATFPPSATNPDIYPDDITKRPLLTGEKLSPRFTWTFNGNAKGTLGHPGTIFHLGAVDIRGRTISADYVVP